MDRQNVTKAITREAQRTNQTYQSPKSGKPEGTTQIKWGGYWQGKEGGRLRLKDGRMTWLQKQRKRCWASSRQLLRTTEDGWRRHVVDGPEIKTAQKQLEKRRRNGKKRGRQNVVKQMSSRTTTTTTTRNSQSETYETTSVCVCGGVLWLAMMYFVHR